MCFYRLLQGYVTVCNVVYKEPTGRVSIIVRVQQFSVSVVARGKRTLCYDQNFVYLHECV